MDRNRNETITPDDTELAGVGESRERTAGKQESGRTDSDIERGRDGFKGRAGEGGARPADSSAHGDIPSKSHDL
jgi:hypothetical protein